MSEVNKEARKAITVAVTVALLWVLTADAVKRDLRVKSLIENLAAWVVINDALALASRNDGAFTFSEDSEASIITDYVILVPVQSGTEVEERQPLSFFAPWRPDIPEQLSLHRLSQRDNFPIFEIRTSDERVSRADLLVGFFRNEPIVFPRPSQDLVTARDYYNYVFRDGFHGPKSRIAIQNLLWSRGWAGSDVNGITQQDRVVSDLIAQADNRSYSVSGFPVSASLFPLAVGGILAVMGVLLITPIASISRDSRKNQEPWFFLSSFRGNFAWFALLLKATFAIAAISLLAYVALDILSLNSLLGVESSPVSIIGFFGVSLMAFSLLVFSSRLIFFELAELVRDWRKRHVRRSSE